MDLPEKPKEELKPEVASSKPNRDVLTALAELPMGALVHQISSRAGLSKLDAYESLNLLCQQGYSRRTGKVYQITQKGSKAL